MKHHSRSNTPRKSFSEIANAATRPKKNEGEEQFRGNKFTG